MKIWDKIKQQNWLKISISVFIGASLGWAYYYFVGCNSGTCAITSNVWNSVLYGSASGLLLSIK